MQTPTPTARPTPTATPTPASAPRRASAGWLVIVASVVMISAVIAAIFAMGTPAEQRQVRLDDRRVQDLVGVTEAVRAEFKSKSRLPSSLSELAAQPGVRLDIADPVTAKPYDYASTGQHSFRLCAQFVTDTAVMPSFRNEYGSDAWHHARGRQCFELEAKQE